MARGVVRDRTRDDCGEIIEAMMRRGVFPPSCHSMADGGWQRTGHEFCSDENVFTALLLAGFRWGVGYGLLVVAGARGVWEINGVPYSLFFYFFAVFSGDGCLQLPPLCVIGCMPCSVFSISRLTATPH